MKATSRQKVLGTSIAAEIAAHMNTNDINSPSHWTLIEEYVNNNLENFSLADADKEKLIDAISEILTIIRKYP